MVMTLIPILGLFIALFWFKKKFLLDENKLEEVQAELAKKQEAR